MIRKRGFLLWSLLAAATVYVFANWFYPVTEYFYNDEWFILPERIWFKGTGEWLTHLLFFNQTRLTWTGDFMLYRPGLFFWLWLRDAWTRPDFLFQHGVLVSTAALAVAGVYALLRREVGAVLAWVTGLYALTSPSGNLLYVWSHLNGYVLALAFYAFGTALLLNEPKRASRCGFAAGLLFLAETCHEFVAVTLTLWLAAEVIAGRRQRSHLLTLFIPLAAYLAMVLTARQLLHPPSFFSPSEQVAASITETLGLIVPALATVVRVIFDNALPWPSHDERIAYARELVGVILLVALFIGYRRRREELPRVKLAAVLIPLVALLAGLSAGRLATRAYVGVHYYAIFQFFAVIAGALLLAPWLRARAWRRWLLGTILLSSALRNATLMHEANAARDPVVPLIHRLCAEAAARFRHEPTTCFTGILDARHRAAVHEALNLALAEFSCTERPGARAVPLSLSADDELKEEIFPAPPASPEALRPAGPFALAQRSNELARYLGGQGYNFQEANQNLHHDGNLLIRWTLEPARASAVSAVFVTDEPPPRLLNVGLAMGDDHVTTYFLLLNNGLAILRQENGTLRELAKTPLPAVPAEFKLSVVRTSSTILVYLDQFLLTEIEATGDPRSAVKFATFMFANGTPPEILRDVKTAL